MFEPKNFILVFPPPPPLATLFSVIRVYNIRTHTPSHLFIRIRITHWAFAHRTINWKQFFCFVLFFVNNFVFHIKKKLFFEFWNVIIEKKYCLLFWNEIPFICWLCRIQMNHHILLSPPKRKNLPLSIVLYHFDMYVCVKLVNQINNDIDDENYHHFFVKNKNKFRILFPK